jgi:hypothetical protein
LAAIQIYPVFSEPIVDPDTGMSRPDIGSNVSGPEVHTFERSAHAAMTDDPTWLSALINTEGSSRIVTINAKATRVRPVTTPLNMNTSPYAMRMIVRFLKIVYTGIERNCCIIRFVAYALDVVYSPVTLNPCR